MPPAVLPDAWAVYSGPIMYFAFIARPGPVHTAMSGALPALTHPTVSGRLLVVNRAAEVLGLVRAAPTVEAVCAALERAGFEVKKTPVSALGWALRGVPL